MVVKICVGLVMMLMINHVIACCWYGSLALCSTLPRNSKRYSEVPSIVLSGEQRGIGTYDLNGKNWIVQAEMESAPFGEAGLSWRCMGAEALVSAVCNDGPFERLRPSSVPSGLCCIDALGIST